MTTLKGVDKQTKFLYKRREGAERERESGGRMGKGDREGDKDEEIGHHLFVGQSYAPLVFTQDGS